MMSSDRSIVEFFSREAPSIGITMELLNNPATKTDELLQAYNFLSVLLFDGFDVEIADVADRVAESNQARPILIIKTREAVNQICNSIYNGSDEFCYTDLLQPDPRRTRNFLLQLIRFYHFKFGILKDICRVDNDIEDRCRTVGLEKAIEIKAIEQLERAKNQLIELNTKKELLEQAEHELRLKLDEAKSKKDNERKACEVVQERYREMQDRVEESKQKITELEETGRRLDMNIVNSPDRIIGELGQLEEERANVQQKLEKATKEGRMLERDMAEYAIRAEYIGGLTEEMRKLEEAQDKMLELRAVKDKRKQEIDELELQRKTLQNELDRLEKKYKDELKNLNREVQTSQKEIEAIRQQRAQLESDEREMAVRLVQVKEDIREHQQQIKRKEHQLIIVTDMFDEAVKKMLKDCKTLEKKIDEQQEVLDKLTEKATATFK